MLHYESLLTLYLQQKAYVHQISLVTQQQLQQLQVVTDHVENDQAVDVANEEAADALQHEKHADAEPTVDLAVERK